MKLFHFSIILAIFLFAIISNWELGPTIDEPIHIISGLDLSQNYFRLNFEHPPLLKILSGYSLRIFGISLNKETIENYLKNPSPQNEKNLYNIVFKDPKMTMKNLRIARIPSYLFFLILLLTIYFWMKIYFSDSVAIISVIFVGLNPNFISNCAIVQTDVPLSTMLVLSAFFLHTFFLKRKMNYLIFSSIFFGLAITTKYSALIFFPFLFFLFIFLLNKINFFKRIFYFLSFLLISFIIIYLVTFYSSYKNKKEDNISGIMISSNQIKCIEGKETFRAKGYKLLSINGLGPFLAGVYRIYIHNKYCSVGYNYFNGKFYPKGNIFYFPVAFFFKNSFSFVLLFLICIFLIRSLNVELLFILIFFYYLGLSLFSTYNTGIRHLLPALSFISIFISIKLYYLYSHKKYLKIFCFIILALYILETILAFPNYFEYFNPVLKRSKAEYIINDSNFDWGQKNYKLWKYAKEINKTIACFIFSYSDPFMKDGNLCKILPCKDLDLGYYAISSYINVSIDALCRADFIKEKGLYENYFNKIQEIKKNGKIIKDFKSVLVYEVKEAMINQELKKEENLKTEIFYEKKSEVIFFKGYIDTSKQINSIYLFLKPLNLCFDTNWIVNSNLKEYNYVFYSQLELDNNVLKKVKGVDFYVLFKDGECSKFYELKDF